MVRTPFEYDRIFYNEIILEMETQWNRKLSDHEKHVLIEGYKYGRLAEMENEIKILEVK
ncbi:hypothetical protein L1999_20260 [Neobacillus drentensis]|uniref:hypothetical protein n=1 Tax=Neobacillus drentensis TaxID=220684 RepID=UPI001F1671D2|nr:hypothetical protein [Neobacillus drentensis]ULT55418.1 hypothetical protein L1999_20260 [Neobacillus drentensis]